jgi:TatD DNase family protein
VLVDTHCHLDFNSFDMDRQEVIQRARETGVGRILNPGINLRSSKAAVQLSESFPEVFAAVGVHPNDAAIWDQDSLDGLRSLSAHPRVAAIGEIGLDYYRDITPRELQQKIFLAQLAIAGDLNLPVIIHNRQADDEILDILEDWVGQLMKSASPIAARPGVLHSFSGKADFATRAIKSGFFLGFTGPITFKNAGELQTIAQNIPLENILIETDAPVLTPHPNRGQRNEPANVFFIANKIAELRNIELNDFINQTSINAALLFRW